MSYHDQLPQTPPSPHNIKPLLTHVVQCTHTKDDVFFKKIYSFISKDQDGLFAALFCIVLFLIAFCTLALKERERETSAYYLHITQLQMKEKGISSLSFIFVKYGVNTLYFSCI